MKNQTVELIVKGEIDINGITIKNIEGGFGENFKCMSIPDIANIHNQEIKEINRRINDNRKRFRDGIDIIDIKNSGGCEPLQLGMSQMQVSKAKNIYILSERGYSKLIKLLTDEASWEAYDLLLDNYFHLREEVKEIKHYIRNNNRLTNKCLLNLDGQKDEDSDFTFLTNNAVRNEVVRAIDQLGIKAGVLAIKSGIRESVFSLWRTRKTSLTFDQLENITNVIARFKELLD
jgi:hypothetical protein